MMYVLIFLVCIIFYDLFLYTLLIYPTCNFLENIFFSRQETLTFALIVAKTSLKYNNTLQLIRFYIPIVN